MLNDQTAINDGESIYIDGCHPPQRNCVSTPGTKLRFVFFRVSFEEIQMFLRCEVIDRIFILKLEFSITIYRLIICKKSYGVVAFQYYAAGIHIIKISVVIWLGVCTY